MCGEYSSLERSLLSQTMVSWFKKKKSGFLSTFKSMIDSWSLQHDTIDLDNGVERSNSRHRLISYHWFNLIFFDDEILLVYKTLKKIKHTWSRRIRVQYDILVIGNLLVTLRLVKWIRRRRKAQARDEKH